MEQIEIQRRDSQIIALRRGGAKLKVIAERFGLSIGNISRICARLDSREGAPEREKAPRGYVIYRGPSLLNGMPIVVVLIANSLNEKTGNLAQTYILVDTGERPTVALKSGTDAAVCGDCKHRPINEASCYVVVRQGTTRVWLSLQAAKYPALEPAAAADVIAGRMVRLGTYGDPAAVPVGVWRALLTKAAGWVGYTHQWHLSRGQELRDICMASVDTPTEKAVANARGWRTFRVRLPDERLLSREGVCPASKEAGHKLQCVACQSCNGAGGGCKGKHRDSRARREAPASAVRALRRVSLARG